MKIIKLTFAIVSIFLLANCGNTSKFPISNVTPAAKIEAKKSINNQKNYVLEITARFLANVDRLNPPGNNYSVWIVSKEYGIKNVGQLNVDNGKKTTFKTSTPFDFEETFITVEDRGDLESPEGIEITRTKF